MLENSRSASSRRCARHSNCISFTTSRLALTCSWPKMPPYHERFSHRNGVPWWRLRKWEAFTIGMNAALPEASLPNLILSLLVMPS